MKLYRIEPPKHLRDFLSESPLAMGDLAKKDAGTPHNTRIPTFLQTLQNGPVRLKNLPSGEPGEEVQFDMTVEPNKTTAAQLMAIDQQHTTPVDTTAALNAMFKGKKVLKATNGQSYLLTALEKVEGVGKPAGEGASVKGKFTKEQEIGQAIVCTLFAAGQKVTAEQLLADIQQEPPVLFTQGASKVSTDAGALTHLPKIAQMFLADPSWANTFVVVADKLDSAGYLSGNEFHHGGPMVKKIMAAFKDANDAAKVSEGPDAKESPFTDRNKWNPADIWITSNATQVISDLSKPENTKDLDALNTWMIQAYTKKLLVGVSLKKVGASAELTVLNDDPSKQKLSAVIDTLVIKKNVSASNLELIMGTERHTQAGSKDAYINYKMEAKSLPLSLYYKLVEDDEGGANSMQMRTFNTNQDIQGEVKGKTASHGKVGFTNLSNILRTYTGHTLTTKDKIYAMLRPTTNDKNAEDGSRWKVIETITTRAASVIGGTPNKETVRAVMQNVAGREDDYLVSKYQAVELVWVVSEYRKSNKKKADALVNLIYQYASSTTPLSSVFIKVS